MSDFLLTQIINYGAPLFGLILFLAAVGLPLPASLLLIAAGAFSQQGFLDWLPTTVFGLLGAVAGDTVGFVMGFYAKDWVASVSKDHPHGRRRKRHSNPVLGWRCTSPDF